MLDHVIGHVIGLVIGHVIGHVRSCDRSWVIHMHVIPWQSGKQTSVHLASMWRSCDGLHDGL